MRIKDFKIGQRLFAGFIIVLLLLAFVWYTGNSSIGQITHQLEIAKDVNTMLTDAQDAQANSLRYLIYKEDSFMETTKSEGENSKANGEKAKEKMKSVANKNETDSAITAMDDYIKANVEIFNLTKQKEEVGKVRSGAANKILKEVIEMIAYEYEEVIVKRYSGSGTAPLKLIRNLTEMQQLRNILNRIDKAAMRYQLAIKPELQDKRAQEWLGEIALLDSQIHNVEKLVSDPTVTKMLGNVDTELDVYKAQVQNFRNINLTQRKTQKIQKETAGNVMRVAREVRDGVYGFIDDVEVKANRTLFTVAVVALLLGMALAWFLTNGIVKPVAGFGKILQKVADGDLTQKVDFDSKDEIGEMAGYLKKMVASLSGLIGNISNGTKTVASSAEELSAVSTQMQTGSGEMVTQSTTVASTTEQMSSNITDMAAAAEEMSMNANEVASSAEQMSQNINAVSSSVEEMSVSINEVAKEASTARDVSNKATNSSNTATQTMGVLGEAAKEIGNVTEVIKRIAEQTNLLALNATIEAASAGEAGKGFAVVANEIKELANQSAQAADDIAKRIEGVQNNTENAVHVIDEVSGIIEEISSSVDVIASAVEQQSKAANEISSNVTQANNGAQNIAKAIGEVAKGSTDVSRNSGEAAKGANDVAKSITGVQKIAEDTNGGAKQISNSSGELAKLASELQESVNQFKL